MLANRFPDTAETQPELLAHHYTEAGFAAQAIPFWLRAGQRAVQRSANVEAISHITKGLELLKSLPETAERNQQELTLQIALGMPLIATKGYAAPEVGQVYTRAQELCRQVGDTAALFPVLRGLWVFHVQQGKLQRAHELGGQLLRLAQDQQDPVPLLEAHRALGSTSYFLGDFAQGRAYQEQGIALYDFPRHRSLALLYGQDPGVVCKSFAAVTLWSLGYPDEALKRSHEALIWARDLSHPFSLGYALFFAARLYQHRQEGWLAQEQAEALITLSREQGFAQMLAMGTILQGWALAKQGRRAEGIAQMRQGLTAYQGTAAEVSRPFFLSLLAETYNDEGEAEEGLSMLTEALATVHNVGQHFYEAELYRLKGELLRQKAEMEAEAEACFRQALDIAGHQQAKSLELRAAQSLSRLWQRQGNRAQARQLLAEVYGWFTEGFDTADLQEAKALLETLS
jgi:predicted ATPase